jgi:hypothetical protein
VWLTGGFTRTASKWKSICSTGLTDLLTPTKHKARRIAANVAKLPELLRFLSVPLYSATAGALETQRPGVLVFAFRDY